MHAAGHLCIGVSYSFTKLSGSAAEGKQTTVVVDILLDQNCITTTAERSARETRFDQSNFFAVSAVLRHSIAVALVTHQKGGGHLPNLYVAPVL